jgi:hypothetical protein
MWMVLMEETDISCHTPRRVSNRRLPYDSARPRIGVRIFRFARFQHAYL